MTCGISRCASLILAVATIATSLLAFAQSDYPNEPIKPVVPYDGGTEQVARLISSRLSTRFGQPMVVESKPGAGTVLGSDFVAKQPANGYTLLHTTSGLASAPYMMAMLFDPAKDFTPITPLSVMRISLTASKYVTSDNVRDLIARS